MKPSAATARCGSSAVMRPELDADTHLLRATRRRRRNGRSARTRESLLGRDGQEQAYRGPSPPHECRWRRLHQPANLLHSVAFSRIWSVPSRRQTCTTVLHFGASSGGRARRAANLLHSLAFRGDCEEGRLHQSADLLQTVVCCGIRADPAARTVQDVLHGVSVREASGTRRSPSLAISRI
jgi:hypothetical protein